MYTSIHAHILLLKLKLYARNASHISTKPSSRRLVHHEFVLRSNLSDTEPSDSVIYACIRIAAN